jgi:EpsI family protein
VISIRQSWRLVVVLSIIVGTAVFLQAHRSAETIPRSAPMSTFPITVGEWSGRDVPINAEALSVLGPGDFLNRIYYSKRNAAPVSLFIGYFPSQRTGDTMHSPKNCLPGSGWTFASSGTTEISEPGRPMRVGRYIIAKGNERQFVLYWYQAHGRAVASEYWAKVYLVTDSIRMNRTDGSLVRVITPMPPGEDEKSAEARASEFAREIAPSLSRYIPE